MWFPALPAPENQVNCNEISSRATVFKSLEYLEAHVLKAYLCYFQRHTRFSPIHFIRPGMEMFIHSKYPFLPYS
jgi:hypothetical protein